LHRNGFGKIYFFHSPYINNWDLVDSSAHQIVGAQLCGDDTALLDQLAASPVLWERRIAIIATYHMIRAGLFDDTFRIAKILLDEREDLIHKAVGWMLREVGKRDRCIEEVDHVTHQWFGIHLQLRRYKQAY